MKKYLLAMVACLAISCSAFGQHHKFDPNRFKADLHAFMIKEAGLTQQEQAKFFPVYDEMMDKQRPVFDTIRKLHHQKNMTEAQAKQSILRCDLLEARLKVIERNYHARMLHILPATKLVNVFRAERRFHRQVLMKFVHKPNGKP